MVRWRGRRSFSALSDLLKFGDCACGATRQDISLPEQKLTPLRWSSSSEEDLREQTDTSTTTAVVTVPVNTMAPVTPTISSVEAGATVAAMNGALTQRLDGIQGQMGMLAGQTTSLNSEVAQLGAQVHHHDQRMTEVERQLREITAGRGTGSGAALSIESS